MSKIKLENILIVESPIEDTQNFHTYFEELQQGITKISNLEPYEPTKKVLEKKPGIKAESRGIVSKIFYGGIGYLVSDNGVFQNGDYPESIRVKGYVQSKETNWELKEITNNKKLKLLFKEMDWEIESDLIE